MIDENNKHLEKEGVPLKEYCKPYVCNKKYPGSKYNKETDTCDDGEYNHPYDICEVGKCKLGNNCFSKPDNAICISNDKNNAWKCKGGFEEKSGVCIEINKNQENSGISLNENYLFGEENNTGILDSSYTGSYDELLKKEYEEKKKSEQIGRNIVYFILIIICGITIIKIIQSYFKEKENI